MKVDFVTDTFAPDINGVAMTLGRLTTGLKKSGHRIHVIRTGGESSEGQTLAASLSLPGYQEVRIGLPEPFKLRKRLVRLRPDVVYVATESPLGVSAIKAANALKIPVVTGFHTNFHQYMEQYKLGRLQPTAMAWLKKVHGRADLTLAPTKDVVEMLKGEGFQRVGLLGRGVDAELFHPQRRSQALRASWGAREGSPVAIIVGRVAAEKNLALAIEVFRRMRERVPDLQCVCVGDGPLREALAAKHRFIHFAGMREGEDLAAHYASADIMLFPSETETFGNVLLEGMSAGLITVSYDYAASAKHVEHGHNGLKAPKGDSHQFIELANMALANRFDEMRVEARRTAESCSWNQVVKTFESHLTEAIVTTKPKKRPSKKSAPQAYRSVFLSDIHLGMADSKVNEVMDFLKRVKCEKLYLNGDIIDGWALRRGSKWKKRHSRFIRKLLKKMEKDEMDVIYCRGNHDDILDRFLPMGFGRLSIVKEKVHEAADGKRYLVIHGDGFDSVSTNHKWLAFLGSIGYDSLLVVNRFYNRYRAWRGKEYFSLSRTVKARVKSAVSFIDNYEQHLQELARRRKCDGIICGHIHTPEDKLVSEIRYLNSGDWVESLTAVVEHHDGRMELIYYEDFLRRIAEEDELRESGNEAQQPMGTEMRMKNGHASRGTEVSFSST